MSMGIPSSLLSISGLEAWCYEAHRFASRCLARIRGAPFEGSVRPMFGGGVYVLELDDALGELVLRLGWTPGVLWRISRRLLDVSFLRSWLRRVRWRRCWIVRRATKRCRRRSMLLFVVGFLVGFVGPLAGVGGGVLFTTFALGLLGVNVNLARAGGLLAAMTTSSVAGSFQAGGCES